jgi:uncharacterized membrane protein
LRRSSCPPSSSSLRTACRAELDLQVSLLAEAEITKLVELVSMIADRMQLASAEEDEMEEMKQRVAPDAVLDAIEEAEAELDAR